MGLYWWARERGVTRTEAKGGRQRPLSQQPIHCGTENTVCLLCLLCFLLQTQARGVYGQPKMDHNGRLQKMPQAREECILQHMNNIKKCLLALTENAIFNLRYGSMGLQLMPDPPHHSVSSLVQPEPWLTFSVMQTGSTLLLTSKA